MLAMLDNLPLAAAEPVGARSFFETSNITSIALFFAAALIVFWVMFRAWNLKKKGSAASRASKRKTEAVSSVQSIAASAARPADLDRWSVEMHETARDLSAQIDTKMVALEALIRTAEAKEAELKRLLEEKDSQ